MAEKSSSIAGNLHQVHKQYLYHAINSSHCQKILKVAQDLQLLRYQCSSSYFLICASSSYLSQTWTSIFLILSHHHHYLKILRMNWRSWTQSTSVLNAAKSRFSKCASVCIFIIIIMSNKIWVLILFHTDASVLIMVHQFQLISDFSRHKKSS